jgi:hypothetical protein
MAAALLDILDSELRLWQDGRAVRSPGYALLDGDGYVFGDAARGEARRQPRNINNRFWWQLGTRPLQPALGAARHAADLVHAHLLELHRAAGEPRELVLAVPDSLQREQLSLLLGIVRACPFEAVGLVNRSLLVAEGHSASGPLFHLELQLHQALLTRLEAAGGELRLAQSQVLPGCGLLALQEGIVERIASAFIHGTRFDPRRKADSEQALYDSLPQLLRELGEADDTAVEVDGYRARISYDQLRGAADRLCDAVAQELGRAGDQPLLLLDPLAALVPGPTRRFAHARCTHAGDMPEALSRHAESIIQEGEALHLIKGLPVSDSARREAAAQPETQPPPAAAPAPTHLLTGARARPLADGTALADGWRIEQRHGDWVLSGGRGNLLVNGSAYRGGALAAGDRIGLGDAHWLLIEVA